MMQKSATRGQTFEQTSKSTKGAPNYFRVNQKKSVSSLPSSTGLRGVKKQNDPKWGFASYENCFPIGRRLAESSPPPPLGGACCVAQMPWAVPSLADWGILLQSPSHCTTGGSARYLRWTLPWVLKQRPASADPDWQAGRPGHRRGGPGSGAETATKDPGPPARPSAGPRAELPQGGGRPQQGRRGGEGEEGPGGGGQERRRTSGAHGRGGVGPGGVQAWGGHGKRRRATQHAGQPHANGCAACAVEGSAHPPWHHPSQEVPRVLCGGSCVADRWSGAGVRKETPTPACINPQWWCRPTGSPARLRRAKPMGAGPSSASFTGGGGHLGRGHSKAIAILPGGNLNVETSGRSRPVLGCQHLSAIPGGPGGQLAGSRLTEHPKPRGPYSQQVNKALFGKKKSATCACCHADTLPPS